MDSPRQILIWRNDLRNIKGEKVRTGKIAAQLAHASLKALLDLGSVERDYSDLDGGLIDISLNITLYRDQHNFNSHNDIYHQAAIDWIEGSFTKIAVYVNSEQELIDVINQAKDAGLITSLIVDNGLTEFGNVPTTTCGCIGPAYKQELDPITGHLKLL
jgi:PTH2 family peptidyl-tRNA hydrolase